MLDPSILQRIKQTDLYRRILADGVKDGELRKTRELLLRQGTRRLGQINPSSLAALGMIADLGRLESLSDRMIDPEIRCWDDLFRGFPFNPEERQLSTTHEKILREGRERGEARAVRRALRRVGTRRFGEPDAETTRELLAIQEIGRLVDLAERLVDKDLGSWTDLLNQASSSEPCTGSRTLAP